MNKRGFILLLSLLLGLLTTAGCMAEPSKTPPVRSGWSRGLLLGQAALSEPTAFLLKDGRIYVAWSEKREGVSKAHLVILDARAHVVKDFYLELGVRFPHRMRLMSLDDGLALFLLARQEDARNDVLFCARLDGDGNLQAPVTPISPLGADVENYTVVGVESGWLILWEALEGDEHVLYYAFTDEAARLLAGPHILTEWGQRPAAFLDREGVLYVAWMQVEPEGRMRIFYASFPEGTELRPGEEELIAKYVMGLGGVAGRLSIGVDASTIYLFWDVEYRGGPRRGTGETRVAVFPRGHPEETREFSLSLPDYVPESYPKGEMPFIPLPPGGSRRNSNYIISPMPAPIEADRLFLGVSVKSSLRGKGYVQPEVVLMEGGDHRGFQVAAYTKGLSLFPQMLPDEQWYWHLVWIDMRAYGYYPVYYATTAPEARAELNRITPEDIARISLETLLGIASGIALIPLLIVASFPALILVSGYHLFGGEGDLSERGPKVMLVISLLVYLAFKVILSSPFIATVPFSAWLPRKMIGPAAVALAVALTVVDVFALALYWRRSVRPVLFMAWGIFVMCDALLTATFYGPTLVGG